MRKKKEPFTLRNIPWVPLIEGFPVEGRDRTDTRETIPEEFSDSRTTCGAERRQTGRKEKKSIWKEILFSSEWHKYVAPNMLHFNLQEKA